MVTAFVPGHRWEIEIFSNGSIETEVFSSDGNIFDENYTCDLIKRFSD
jgi:hypothetical protein